MIFYGWGHFNRREHALARRGCEHCGRSGYQRSYTSTLFFTLYFVPIVPLGRRRVICECPSCKRALAMPYGKWKKRRAVEAPKAIAAYQAAPIDADAAERALVAVLQAQDRKAMAELGPQIAAAFPKDPRVLALLADAYSYLCMDDAADEAYLQAVSVSDSDEVAAAAQRHMQLRALPKPKPPNRILQLLPTLIAPAALLGALVYFATLALSGDARDAYLVNGLGRPYEVLVNGELVALRPYQRLKTGALRSGENTILPAPGEEWIRAATFAIEQDWEERAFGNSVEVVNPDRAAVLLWESSPFSDRESLRNQNYRYRFNVGRARYRFDDIDFAFAPFPKEVSIPAAGSVVYKTRLSAYESRNPLAIAQTLLGNEKEKELDAYLRAKLEGGEPDESLIGWAANRLGFEEFARLAQPYLDTRPARVAWHRAYQTLAEARGDAASLRERYASLAANAPDDSALAYLRARLESDPAIQRDLLERALALPDPCAYAANALAYHHFLEAEFATARGYAEQAMATLPGEPMFADMRARVLHGLGDYDALMQDDREKLVSEPLNLAAAYDLAYCLAKLGRGPDARAQIRQYLDRYRKEAPDAKTLRSIEARLESAIAYARADREAFLAIPSDDDPRALFAKAAVKGDLAAALAIAESAPDILSATDSLLLYTLLFSQNQRARAETQLQAAVAKLQAGSADDQRWAQWLVSADPPATDLALHTCGDFENHFVYLTALATRHRDQAPELLRRAAALRRVGSYYLLATAEFFSTESN